MARKVTLFAGVTPGAFVAIPAQTFARSVEIDEDASGSGSGLIVQWPDGTVANYAPAQLPIHLGNPGGGAGAAVARPAYTTGVTAQNYCMVKSLGTTTIVRLTEDN